MRGQEARWWPWQQHYHYTHDFEGVLSELRQFASVRLLACRLGLVFHLVAVVFLPSGVAWYTFYKSETERKRKTARTYQYTECMSLNSS